MLETLKKLNPKINFFSVNDAEFNTYGRKISLDTDEIIKVAEGIALPDAGSKYEPAMPSFETLPVAKEITQEYFGQLDAQIGYCWGYSNRLNALEWHTSSEINIAVTDIVLILARRQDLVDNKMDSADTKAFYLPKGTAVEVYGDTLHFCPCMVAASGFGCVVALPRGTNTPLQGRQQGLLWAKNKWLIAHNDNAPLLARGAVAGISGENFEVNF